LGGANQLKKKKRIKNGQDQNRHLEEKNLNCHNNTKNNDSQKKKIKKEKKKKKKTIWVAATQASKKGATMYLGGQRRGTE